MLTYNSYFSSFNFLSVMIKKLQLLSIAFLSVFLLSTNLMRAQEACGTRAPGQAWDDWFNGQVEQYKKKMLQGKSNQVKYIIPVIIHIVHNGEAVGTFPNISVAQATSQIQVLNQDFNAQGLGIAGTPAHFTNTIGNPGIEFCLAITNPQGVVLPEIGIERLDATVKVWQSPTTATLDLKSYYQNTIIPNSIWDPTKYLNIWVSDRPASSKLTGFATYPANTGLVGLFGTEFGTVNNDGIWIWASAFGNTGNVIAPTNKGRTATHEIGHWLGLRHIWGDGNCLPDYCHDTPPSKQAHTGCLTSTPPDLCGANQSPFGEMPMNFMDMSNDDCRYMFTNEQNIRIQTAMSMCTNRNVLGTHGLCTSASTAPSASAVAAFSSGTIQCSNTPFHPFNSSSGNPSPTFAWSSAPAASFSPATTVANPQIKLPNAGQYTITLVATNTLNSSTHSFVVTAISNSCGPNSLCLDSTKMIPKVDSLISYRLNNNPLIIGCQTGFAGYLTGNNCYKDKEYAQYFNSITYSNVPKPQVNSVIVLFDSSGTRAANIGTQITCKVYGGTVGGGPSSVIEMKSDSLGKIVGSKKTYSVGYLGIPNNQISKVVGSNAVVASTIIPFKFDMPKPAPINIISGFFTSIELPVNSPADSIRIVSSTKYNASVDSSAWFLQSNNTWRTFRYNRGAKIRLAMIPEITCSPQVGINEVKTVFNSNVTLVPNPNSGAFSLIFTLPSEENINYSIYNPLGQEILKGELSRVSSNLFDVNLTDQPNGIYFINISNGKEKVVKKMIISH